MMLLQLVKGSTVIALSGDAYYIAGCTYIPRAPEDNHVEVASVWRSGGEVTSVAKRNIVESVSVILKGTEAQILAQARAIEALFPTEDAQRRPASQRVYAQYRQEASGDVFRSEILVGRVEVPSQSLAPNLASGAAEITIIWKRRWFWEDTTLRAIPLTNSNGSAVSSGLTVWNHDDAGTGHDNWVSIAAANVTGVIPTPAKITLETNQDIQLYKICIGHNVQANPATFTHMLEGEASVAGGTDNAADANASGGLWRLVSWTGAQTALKVFQWNLTTTQMQKAAGNYFRVLARLSNPSAGRYVRVGLWWPTATPLNRLTSTEEIEVQTLPLNDWGVIQIPPFALASAASLALVVELRAAATGSIELDFLQLTPIDSWRQIRQVGYDLDDGDTYIDEGDGTAYVQDGAGLQYPIIMADGDPIMLWPGVDQRLYFLSSGDDMETQWTFQVKAWYRPRRLTV